MKTFKMLISLCLFSLSLSTKAMAQTQTEPPVASVNVIENLNKIQKDLDIIYKSGVHLYDQGRLYILHKSAGDMINSYNTNGPIHKTTQNAIINLIIKFRFSSQFFELIRTERNEPVIKSLITSMTNLKRNTGFDDDPYNKILKPNLDQIAKLFSFIIKEPSVATELKNNLNTMRVQLADVIAKADQGDRPIAFKAATDFCKALRLFYKQLSPLANQSSTTSYYLELVGLNEFIGEYSQVEALQEKKNP